MRSHHRAHLVGAGCAALLIAGACSASTPAAPTTSSAPTTTAAPIPDDGVLELGVIVPRSGAGAELGQGLSDGITLALSEINASGGANGRPVRQIAREEGDTPAATANAIQELVDAGVDAIIGPASSNAALASLDRAVSAGVVTCSPTASALALDDYPDNGLFFRTIPSDSLQARAIAQVVDRTGTGRAVIAQIDDAYGRPFGAAVATALRSLGIEVTLTIGYTSKDTSIAAAATEIAGETPAVVVIIGDATTGPAMLTAIDEAATVPPMYVVNDAMRRPAATVQPFAPEIARRITGVSPRATVDDVRFNTELSRVDSDTTGLYAANAYDCVNLIALAAIASGSNAPSRIATAMVAVSINGSKCDRFSACRSELEEGLNIDYDGPSGVLSLNVKGDRDNGLFDLFGFDDSGRDVSKGSLLVGSR